VENKEKNVSVFFYITFSPGFLLKLRTIGWTDIIEGVIAVKLLGGEAGEEGIVAAA